MTKDAASTVLAILKNLVIGAVLGIANVIPGVSGGTMAASFGIYDQVMGFAAFSVVDNSVYDILFVIVILFREKDILRAIGDTAPQ